MDQTLRKIIQGVSNTRGADFFNAITLQLNEVIGADYTFIARLDLSECSSNTIALVAHGELTENFSYALASTPCENVADDAICCYPQNVTNLFPEDQLLIDMNIEAYLGTPLHDSQGKVMGLIVALYENEIEETDSTTTLFQIFSGRIAAEMERVDYEQQLLELNHNLEKRVLERTEDLNKTLQSLKNTQQQLIESEKNAALGHLVASVAHEVNTPLGVSITGHSLIQDAFNELAQRFDDKKLTVDNMNEFRSLVGETLPLIGENLKRAKELINNFKNTAADQHSEIKDTIDLRAYYQQIISTLMPMMKRDAVKLITDLPENIEMRTYPGIHGQIITNLVSNSLIHAYNDNPNKERTITIRAEQQGDELLLHYQDNGSGLSDEAKKRIFEPFYTTARNTGGTGLGMAIVSNLVTQKLMGKLALVDSSEGFALDIRLPLAI